MKKVAISFLIFLLLNLFIAILYYYDNINIFSFKILELSFFLCWISRISYLQEKTHKKKKYITGMIFPILLIIFSLFLNCIKNQLNPIIFIYYGLILFSSFVGSFIKRKKSH